METPNTPANGTMPEGQQPLPMPPEQSGNPRKRMMMIIGAVALLAIIVVAALFGGTLFKGSFLNGDTNYDISIVSADKDAEGRTVLVYTFTNKTGQDIADNSLIEVKGFTNANTDTAFFTRPLNYKSTFRADESVTLRTTFTPAVIGGYSDIILKVYRGGEEKSSTSTQAPKTFATGGGGASSPATTTTEGGGAGTAVPEPTPVADATTTTPTEGDKATITPVPADDTLVTPKTDAEILRERETATPTPTDETPIEDTPTPTPTR